MRCPNCGNENIPGEELCRACGTDLAGLDLPEAQEDFRGKLLDERVGDLPLSPLVKADPTTTVADAIRLMRANDYGGVLVCDGTWIVGIVTERDIVVKIAKNNLDPTTVNLFEIMTKEIYSLREEDPPAYAISLISEEGFRHIPIVRGDRPLGFISLKTMVKYIHDEVLGTG